jgi:hypothetical protein
MPMALAGTAALVAVAVPVLFDDVAIDDEFDDVDLDDDDLDFDEDVLDFDDDDLDEYPLPAGHLAPEPFAVVYFKERIDPGGRRSLCAAWSYWPDRPQAELAASQQLATDRSTGVVVRVGRC